MLWTIALEILVLWVCYAAYMAVLVHKRGPVGGLFFYPQVMIDRVKTSLKTGARTESTVSSFKMPRHFIPA